MATAVMGRAKSLQAKAIAELYLQQGASSMRRRVLESGVIRVALFADHQNEPISAWHVFRNGVTRQVNV